MPRRYRGLGLTALAALWLIALPVVAHQPSAGRYIYSTGEARYHALLPDPYVTSGHLGTDGEVDIDIPYSDLAPTGSILHLTKVMLSIQGPQLLGYGDALLAIEDAHDGDIFWHVLAETQEVLNGGTVTQDFQQLGTPMTSGQQLCLIGRWRSRPGMPSPWGWTSTSTVRFFRLELEYHLG